MKMFGQDLSVTGPGDDFFVETHDEEDDGLKKTLRVELLALARDEAADKVFCDPPCE